MPVESAVRVRPALHLNDAIPSFGLNESKTELPRRVVSTISIICDFIIDRNAKRFIHWRDGRICRSTPWYPPLKEKVQLVNKSYSKLHRRRGTRSNI